MTTPGGFDFEQIKRLLEQLGLGSGTQGLDLNAMMQQLQRMQGAGMPFTPADQDPDAAWLTTVTAAKRLASDTGGEITLTSDQRLAIVDAERLAQSWLDAATTFPNSGIPPIISTRTQWLDATSSGWRRLVTPIMEGFADALQRGTEVQEMAEFAQLQQAMGPWLRTSVALFYRERLGKVLAGVACDTLTGSELGMSLAPSRAVTLLPSNINEFSRDLDLTERDMLIYLSLREAARQRLFTQVSWLLPQLEALLAHFAREITIDFESMYSDLDFGSEDFSLEDIVKAGEQVRGSFFKPATTELQLEILGRLEVLLALIEGWVDYVTGLAATSWLPGIAQLHEVIRRRRASAGPTREVFKDLLGLETSPRLIRDAENLWASLDHRYSPAQRDAVWRHPDLLPTATHLADPLSYVHPDHRDESEGDLDAELRRLLGG